jgi:DNA-binding transcriptional regulator YdaS (Cro superfamily)
MTQEITDDQRAAIAEAVQEIGGHQAAAELLGYTDRRNVWPWTSGKRPIPAEIAPSLERGSKGKVPVERLCPNSKWVRVRDKDWPHPLGRPLLDIASAPAQPETAPAKAA